MITLAKKTTSWFLILVSLFFLIVEIGYLLLPQKVFFDYQDGHEVEYRGYNGEDLLFHSNAEFKQDMKVQWYDTLRCTGVFGNDVRILSLKTEDYIPKKVVADNEVWRMTIGKVETPRYCYVCGTIVGFTPSTTFKPDGYEKTDSYCTPKFVVE